MKRHLIFSVDTEPDDPRWRGLVDDRWDHENLQGLPRLAEFLMPLGVRPTFLVSHSVATHPDLEKHLAAFLAKGACEIGMHLHPGDTPPIGAWDAAARDNICRLPLKPLEEKFDALHQAIAKRFGAASSYRSGAWAFDGRIMALMRRYGYRVDSSVTPGVSWILNGRPSYRAAPMRAYYLDAGNPCNAGDTGILEVPVSILSKREPGVVLPEGRLGSLMTMPLMSRSGKAAKVLRALRPEAPFWLRPAFKSLEEMESIVVGLEADGADYVHVMCHSNELWPKASPYVSSPAELDGFISRLEGLFKFAIDRGYTPVTLSGYAEAYAIRPAAQMGPAGFGEGAETSSGGRPVALDMPFPETVERLPDLGKRNWNMIAGKAVFSMASLILLFKYNHWKDMVGYLSQVAPILLFACFMAFIFEILLKCYKMKFMVLPIRIPTDRLLKIKLFKVLFNIILPGGVGGEAARAIYLGREMGSLGKATALILFDRLGGLWAQVLFSAVSLPLVATSLIPMSWRYGAALVGVIAAVAASIIIPGLGPRALGWIIGKLFKGRLNAYSTQLVEFSNYWREISRNRLWLLAFAAYSLACQAVVVLIVWLAAYTMGNPITFWQASPIIFLGTVSSFLPLSLGGLGVTEGAYALGFTLMGSDSELGFLVSLLMRALALPPAIAGGILFMREGAVLPAVESGKSRSVKMAGTVGGA